MKLSLQQSREVWKRLLSEDKQTVFPGGSPYAQPPVGELRFRRPQEHAAWEGILPCRKFAPRCPQADLTKMDFSFQGIL